MSVAEAMGTSLRQVSLLYAFLNQIDHFLTRTPIPTDSNINKYKGTLGFQLRTVRA